MLHPLNEGDVWKGSHPETAQLAKALAALVLWAHGKVDGRHWLERLVFRTKPQPILRNSRCMERALSTLYPASRSHHDPVEPGAREAVRCELDTAPDAVAIIQVSRLEESKGHRTLPNGLAAPGPSSRPRERHSPATSESRTTANWIDFLFGLTAGSTALSSGSMPRCTSTSIAFWTCCC